MNQIIIQSKYENINKIYNKLKNSHFLLFPKNIIYDEESNIYLLEFDFYKNLLLKNSFIERDYFFYKKYLQLCLNTIHNDSIFFYYNNSKIKIDANNIPFFFSFDESLIIDSNIETIIDFFGKKTIKNKYIPFSLFYFHFLCFSLRNENSFQKYNEEYIKQLFENNKTNFSSWEESEIQEVERIYKKKPNIISIWEEIIQDNIWKQWDLYILTGSIINKKT